MSASSIGGQTVFNSLIEGVESFLRVGNRRPWKLVFASPSETGVDEADFNVKQVQPLYGGIFRARGTIDGHPAEIDFFSERGVAAQLYMR